MTKIRQKEVIHVKNIKRLPLIFLIVLLIFTQGVQPFMLASEINSENKPKLDIIVDSESSDEHTLVTLKTDDPAIENVDVKLPEKSTYDEEQTAELSQQNIAFQYDENNQLLKIEWSDDSTEREVNFVLSDLEIAENKIQAIGFIENEKVVETEETFQIKIVEENEDVDSEGDNSAEPKEETDEQVEEDKEEKAEEKQSKEELTNIEKEKTAENNRETKEIETADKKQTDKNDEEKASTDDNTRIITPFVGDLNMDIDISPYKETVESGKAAMYNLVFKTTGSQKEYHNAQIVIDLPINDYTGFTQDLAELTIAGEVPVYNEEKHTLTYNFDTLKTGQTYDVMIKVDTKNGYIPNGTELEAKASFESDEREKVQDEAVVTVSASSAISVNKKFTGTIWEDNEWKEAPPKPDRITIWEIKVEIPKKDIGQMYLKEGSKIIVTDTLPDGLTFEAAPYGVRQEGNKLIWEFDAPNLDQQDNAEDSLFTQTIEVWLRTKIGTENTFQKNIADVEAVFVDDSVNIENAEASIPIYQSGSNLKPGHGEYYIPLHAGPVNGEGVNITEIEGSTLDDLNPNPTVYDDALLNFGIDIMPLPEGALYDFERLSYKYHIDPNLIFDGIVTPGNWVYDPYFSYYPSSPQEVPIEKLERNPEYDIYAEVNGQRTLLIENAEDERYYSREDFGLDTNDAVTNIEYYFTYAPAGLYSKYLGYYHFKVKEGYVGSVENYYTISGRGGHDYRWNGQPYYKPVNFTYNSKTDIDYPDWGRPRQVQIVEKPENAFPIATVGVSLEDHNKDEVVYGPNRMEVTLDNRSTSAYSMNEDLEAVVLLPIGVKVSDTPNEAYSNSNGGTYEVIDNYNGTGRQLVKFTWDEEYLRYGDSLKAWIDVEIVEGNSSSLKFDVYGFSGDEELRVPSTSGTSITDTILQTDEDDLNGDGVTDQPRLKSGNIYTIRGEYDLQTEKRVKGELDNDWTNFGQTVPDGTIDYKLKLTNTTGKDITTMTLIDVLPSVGDLGITDNIARGSQFTPLMTGPITLPAEWEGKVNVYYSTAKNPERDDLIRHTKYPETTTPLSNPEGAESPNWMTESEVIDWNAIHSFKIELIDGETWIQGVDMEVLFSMKAPEANDVEASLLDKNMEPKERAAWNSFAVATDHGQPVEPAQVGVYMNYEVEEPEVEKTVNEQKEAYELINRGEQFTWEVKYEFGNYTGNWESVSLSDQINELLEIGHVTVIDQNGTDVTDNGVLNISKDNLVTFDLKKKDGSFKYLQNQTYTMIITSQIKESATNEELLPYIQTGGIPNQAELIINDDPKPSNEVKVKPPALKGSLDVIKIDKDSKEVLAGAEFELHDDSGEVVATGISNSEGKLVFNDLSLGKYQLVEIKAPEGYRLLKKPLDVEITAEHLEVELEVENSKNGWELPTTGGIGTLLFYGLGALLMIGALLLLLKRKKPTKQTEE